MKGQSILMNEMRGRLRRKNEASQKVIDTLIYQLIFTPDRQPVVGEIALLSIMFEVIEGILNKDYESDRLQSIYIAIYDQLYPKGAGYENEENSD